MWEKTTILVYNAAGVLDTTTTQLDSLYNSYSEQYCLKVVHGKVELVMRNLSTMIIFMEV